MDRYVALEVLAPFAMGVGLLTFTLVTGRMLKMFRRKAPVTAEAKTPVTAAPGHRS